MKTTLIVSAHPDGFSFNAAWAAESKAVCELEGDEVLVSNLVEMAFDPVEARQHYPHIEADELFDVLKTQEAASEGGTLPEDVRLEIDKLRQAHRVIFHFPLWWFSAPAILKGWLERVLAHGEMHSVDQRFDQGQFRGRKVLFCVTTGSRESESAFNGKEGDVQLLLWPLAYALRYVGFTVLVPRIVHGVHGYHEGKRREELELRLAELLKSHRTLLGAWEDLPEIEFNSDEDFDDDGRLRPECKSFTPFIRHKG
ncbi:MAG: NAD(P)H-dependent oxidoreductase [Boseongicola sp.]|nr:NAD(P)H-dependent oxidoreductase [Boseongicola sp.]MDD9978607.1 NAD(P)H-dependent oxidoreductase [Boseongicola sp.]